MENQKENMLQGKLYKVDPQLAQEQSICKDLCHEYNLIAPSQSAKKQEILHKLLGKMGSNVSILSPFWCDYGSNIFIGDNFFANHGLTILDPNTVTIGNNVFIASGCTLTTAGHPLDIERRNQLLEFGHPIVIKDNVWIGANVTILPGITIGEGVVIGAGSVVTKDIPDYTVAVGNPCRVLRKITEEDKNRDWSYLKS